MTGDRPAPDAGPVRNRGIPLSRAADFTPRFTLFGAGATLR